MTILILTIDPSQALNVSRLSGQAFWHMLVKRLSVEIPKSVEVQETSSKPRRNRAPFEAGFEHFYFGLGERIGTGWLL
jgi:hypothetical protein